MSRAPYFFDPQDVPDCRVCGQHEQHRDYLCGLCDGSEAHLASAESHDAWHDLSTQEISE